MSSDEITTDGSHVDPELADGDDVPVDNDRVVDGANVDEGEGPELKSATDDPNVQSQEAGGTSSDSGAVDDGGGPNPAGEADGHPGGRSAKGPAPKAGPSPELTKSLKVLFDALKDEPNPGKDRDVAMAIDDFVSLQIQDDEILEKYNVVILFDENRLVRSDADKVYNAVTSFDERKPIMLILYSGGGDIAAGYLIGKLCRKYGDRVVVCVPRQAKSAATLVACAGDEIHMGDLSELGPIDPQLGRHPLLGLGNAVEWVAHLVDRVPKSSDLFAQYLSVCLEPIELGYFERVAESAAQYAERLLKGHADELKGDPAEIARTLVYEYKDHGFVIDAEEASDIFGPDVVKTGTSEYRYSNEVYRAITFAQKICAVAEYGLYWVGTVDKGAVAFQRDRES